MAKYVCAINLLILIGRIVKTLNNIAMIGKKGRLVAVDVGDIGIVFGIVTRVAFFLSNKMMEVKVSVAAFRVPPGDYCAEACQDAKEPLILAVRTVCAELWLIVH